jgi:hypothetical protein
VLFYRAALPLSHRNAAKLGWDVEDVDLGWAVVMGSVVGGAFDAVVLGEVSFDDAGIGAVAPFGVGDFDDFVDRFGDQLVVFMRGESPRAR